MRKVRLFFAPDGLTVNAVVLHLQEPSILQEDPDELRPRVGVLEVVEIDIDAVSENVDALEELREHTPKSSTAIWMYRRGEYARMRPHAKAETLLEPLKPTMPMCVQLPPAMEGLPEGMNHFYNAFGEPMGNPPLPEAMESKVNVGGHGIKVRMAHCDYVAFLDNLPEGDFDAGRGRSVDEAVGNLVFKNKKLFGVESMGLTE